MMRLVMVCFMPGLFVHHLYMWAMVLFLAAGATDLLDGYIARKYNLITDVGKLLDPLADKLMLVMTLTLFVVQGWTPWIILALVVAKELLMIWGSVYLFRKNTVVFSNKIGKCSTFIFTVAVVLTFFHNSVAPFDLILMIIAFAVTIAAMISYARQFMLNRKENH
jgi:cardiolipin synthase